MQGLGFRTPSQSCHPCRGRCRPVGRMGWIAARLTGSGSGPVAGVPMAGVPMAGVPMAGTKFWFSLTGVEWQVFWVPAILDISREADATALRNPCPEAVRVRGGKGKWEAILCMYVQYTHTYMHTHVHTHIHTSTYKYIHALCIQ